MAPVVCSSSVQLHRPQAFTSNLVKPIIRLRGVAVARRSVVVRASSEPSTDSKSATDPKPLGDFIDNPELESNKKAADAERLRAAEKFMVIGSGEATCKGCGYEYKPELGDPEFPVPRGVKFQDLPADYSCPVCGAGKDKFESKLRVVAGFAENQKYGLGTNSMTGDQKLLLIYGALAVFFILFLAGYALE